MLLTMARQQQSSRVEKRSNVCRKYDISVADIIESLASKSVFSLRLLVICLGDLVFIAYLLFLQAGSILV